MGNTTENSGAENVSEETVEETSEDQNKLVTQEEFEEKLKARLDREKEKYSRLETEYAAIKEKSDEFDGLKSQFDDLSSEKEELKNNSSKLEKDFLRYKIAYETGMSNDGLELLSGNTEEELKSNAERINRLAGSKKSISPKDYDGANAGSNNKSIYSDVKI